MDLQATQKRDLPASPLSPTAGATNILSRSSTSGSRSAQSPTVTSNTIPSRSSTSASLRSQSTTRESVMSVPWRNSSTKNVRETMASSASTVPEQSPIDRQPGEILPLYISTKTDSLLSGFPYRQELFDIRISPKQWEQFNDDIQTALNPSTLNKAAAAAKKLPLLPIGPVYLATYSLIQAGNRSLEKKVIKSLQEDVGDKAGSLAAVLERWNTHTFSGLGVEVTIQLAESAIKRTKKEEEKRKKKERKTREKYGTADFYQQEDDAPMDSGGSGTKHYKIIIQRAAEAPEAPPLYSPGAYQGPLAHKADPVPMLDSQPAQMAVEMDASTTITELPAKMDTLHLNHSHSHRQAHYQDATHSPLHTEGGFLPVELPDNSVQR